MTLGSIQAPANVRLACQVRPTSSLTVTRLLRPGSTGPNAADLQESDSGGVEKPLAVMYLNMREFTELSKKKLPYDTVFILNTFFHAVGNAITTQGGWIDKFAGDGLYAVFGQKHGAEAGCRQALRAARAIDLALDHVNAVLGSEIPKPMQVGIGIHVGPLLIGRIGYGESVDLTAIGPAVKIAHALEAVAKAKPCQIVMSAEVAKLAGWPGLETSLEQAPLPGRAAAARCRDHDARPRHARDHPGRRQGRRWSAGRGGGGALSRCFADAQRGSPANPAWMSAIVRSASGGSGPLAAAATACSICSIPDTPISTVAMAVPPIA